MLSHSFFIFFFFNDPATTEIYTLSLHDALPILLSTSFVYFTGDAVTYPSAIYTVEGQKVPYYGQRNGNRFPDYHRLDLGLTWYLKDRKHFKHNLSFSIYNVYNRENAFSVRFTDDFEGNDTGKIQAVQIALFKLIPSITYNFNIK